MTSRVRRRRPRRAPTPSRGHGLHHRDQGVQGREVGSIQWAECLDGVRAHQPHRQADHKEQEQKARGQIQDS